MRVSLLVSTAFVVCISPLVSAQDQGIGPRAHVRERVVVTATRLEEPIENVGSSATVIDSEELRTSGVHWLLDALASVPGVTVARNGGPGATTGVFLRGANSNHALILLNGMRANTPSTGAYDLSRIPVSQIERVEIIRGPQSVLYGSEAIGGVVHVITRDAGGATRLDLAVDGGSYSTARLTAGLRGESSRLRYAVGLDYFDNDGYSAADESAGNVESDSLRNVAADARFGYDLGGGFDLEGLATYFDGRTRIDGFDFLAGPIDDPAQLQDNREVYAGARLGLAAGRYTGSLSVASSDQTLGTVDPDGFFTAFDLDTTVTQFDIQNDYAFDESNTTTVGVERRLEKAVSVSTSLIGANGFDERVEVTAAYAQHRFSHDERLHLGLGLRYEDHSTFGDQATYRATAAYNAPNGLRLHGSLGTGFRAPNFNELYFPGFGNSGLAAETSTGWDLGLGGDLLRSRLGWDVVWFSSDIDNLIEFAFPAGFLNLGAARTRGLEASASVVPHPRVRVDVSYTYTDARPHDSDEQLLRRPRHQGMLVVRGQASARVSLFSELRLKGRRNDLGAAGPLVLDGYVVWNLAAQVGVTSDMELFGRLDNVTDTAYQEVWGYGTAGTSGYLGLRYRWSAR